MSDTLLNQFVAQGTMAERIAFVPDPATVAAGPDPGYFWYETDTGDTYAWNLNTSAWVLLIASSPGTVTTVSVASANGFAGSVANPTTTPAITISTSITGILLGNGTAVAAAVAGDFPTLNQNTTGSAATLTTPRAIYGSNFDGSAAITGPVGPTFGGTGIATYATGDLLYASASNVLSKLAAGTDTHVLTLAGGVPTWAAPGGGGTPGGSDTQLQYNNAGAFGGISGVTTDGTNMTASAGNLRATSPRFTTSLFDANGATILGLTATGSAARSVTLTNAAAGGNPSIGTDGGNLLLEPNGTSNVTINGTNPVLSLAISGTGKGFFGIATGVNSIITGSATDEFCFRSIASQAFLWSVDNGTSIQLKLSNGGMVTSRSTGIGNGLVVDTTGTAAGGAAYTQYNIDTSSKGAVGAAGATNALIGGSALGDICARVNGGNFLVSTDSGTSIALMVVASTGLVQMPKYGAGTATFDASGNISSVSDARAKRNIRAFGRGLEEVLRLSPVLHGYTVESALDQSRNDYAGFLAQEVQAIIPEAVGVNADGMLSFADRPVIAALVNAVKELKSQIDTLKQAA